MGYKFVEIPEPEEPKVVCYCAKCKGEIFEGETYGAEPGKHICPDCINAIFTEMPLEMRFTLMGYEVCV